MISAGVEADRFGRVRFVWCCALTRQGSDYATKRCLAGSRKIALFIAGRSGKTEAVNVVSDRLPLGSFEWQLSRLGL